MANDFATILEHEQKRYEALLAGDIAALDELLQASLIYSHSFGARDSKSEYLGKIADGIYAYLDLGIDDVDIRIHGDCGLTFARVLARRWLERKDDN